MQKKTMERILEISILKFFGDFLNFKFGLQQQS